MTGAALLVHRHLFEALGGICEDYIIGDYEDSDFLPASSRVWASHDVCSRSRTVSISSAVRLGCTKATPALLPCRYNRTLHHRRWNDTIAALMSEPEFRPAPCRSRSMTDIATLRSQLSRNRFMPVPPDELHYVGDGDYRAIGAEFLERLARDADLTSSDRVLDIGLRGSAGSPCH